MTTGIYEALQQRLIDEYRVELCEGSRDGYRCEHNIPCPHRCAYHNGEENRRIANWKQENTVASTYILLHEIGHLEGRYSFDVEDEYRATEWAMRKCLELHIIPDREMVACHQVTLMRMYDEHGKRYADWELFGMKKPEWLKGREYYNELRLYDFLFEKKNVSGGALDEKPSD